MEVSTRQRGGRQADDAFAHALQSAMFSAAVAPRPKSTAEVMEEVGGSVFAEVIEDELWGAVVAALTSLDGDEIQQQTSLGSSPNYLEAGAIHEEEDDQEEEGDGFSDDGGGDTETPVTPLAPREEKSPPLEQPRQRRVRPQVAEIEEPPPRSSESGFFDDQSMPRLAAPSFARQRDALVSSETFEDDFDEEGEEDDEFVDELFQEAVEESKNPLDVAAEAARKRLEFERSLLFLTPQKKKKRPPPLTKHVGRSVSPAPRSEPWVSEAQRQDGEDALSDEEEEDCDEDQLFALVQVVRVDNVHATSVEMAARALAELRPRYRGRCAEDQVVAAQLAPKALREKAASKHIERWLDNCAHAKTTHALGLVATELLRHKMLGICMYEDDVLDEDSAHSFFPRRFADDFGERRDEYSTTSPPVRASSWTEDDAVRFVDLHGSHLGLDSAAAIALQLEMPQFLARVLLRASKIAEVAAIDAIFREGLGRTRNVERRRAEAVAGLLRPRTTLEPVAGTGARAPLCALLLRAHLVVSFVNKGFTNVIPPRFADLA